MQKNLRACAVVVSIALGVFVVYVSVGSQRGRVISDEVWEPRPPCRARRRDGRLVRATRNAARDYPPRDMRTVFLLAAAFLTLALSVSVASGGSSASGPRYVFDPGWPQPLPNNWKMGGVTGLAVDPKDDTVWAYDRPNDLTNIELEK